jgi:hypothetical protein
VTPALLITAQSIGLVTTEAFRALADRAIGFGAKVPLNEKEVSASWLADALGVPRTAIESVTVVDAHSGTANRARLAVKSDTHLPDSLFLKLPPRNYLQHVLMNVFRLGTKEVLAYGAFGDDPPVRTPRCYLAVEDTLRRRNVLLLEDLSATAEFRTVVDAVTVAEAEAVVDALAGLHARFWNTDRFDGDLWELAQRSPAEIRLGDLIRRKFIGTITGHTAGIIPDDQKRDCRIFFERSADIDAFWASQPRTLIHGDTHLGNLFFEEGRPGFLDWQVAMAWPGIRDIAYFVTASLEADEARRIERELVRRYVTRLGDHGVDTDGDHMWTLYRAAITEPWLAFVCTAEAGERMQSFEISRVGVERAVAAVEAHDSFTVLRSLIDAPSSIPAG